MAGATWGRMRAMADQAGRRVQTAGPSTPVEIQGLAEVPRAGDVLEVVDSERTAREVVESRHREAKGSEQRQPASLEQLAGQIGAGEAHDLNVIVKADVHGSLEAIRGALERLSSERTRVVILHGDVGSITEGDILLASASGATILGFNVRLDPAARHVAESQRQEVRTYSIIYQLIDDVERTLRGIAAPLVQEIAEGKAEVRQIFALRRTRVAGCVVTEGRIRRGTLARVRRQGQVIYEGSVASLRHFKDEAREVVTGQECGLGLEDFADFAEGDTIETFRREERSA